MGATTKIKPHILFTPTFDITTLLSRVNIILGGGLRFAGRYSRVATLVCIVEAPLDCGCGGEGGLTPSMVACLLGGGGAF